MLVLEVTTLIFLENVLRRILETKKTSFRNVSRDL